MQKRGEGGGDYQIDELQMKFLEEEEVIIKIEF